MAFFNSVTSGVISHTVPDSDGCTALVMIDARFIAILINSFFPLLFVCLFVGGSLLVVICCWRQFVVIYDFLCRSLPGTEGGGVFDTSGNLVGVLNSLLLSPRLWLWPGMETKT